MAPILLHSHIIRIETKFEISLYDSMYVDRLYHKAGFSYRGWMCFWMGDLWLWEAC